jgi:hypothetical protein
MKRSMLAPNHAAAAAALYALVTIIFMSGLIRLASSKNLAARCAGQSDIQKKHVDAVLACSNQLQRGIPVACLND